MDKTAADLAAAAKMKAEDTAKALAAEQDAAMKKTEAAAAEAKKKADEAVVAPSAVAMPMAPASPPPVASGTGHADLAGAANLAASQASATTDALRAQGEQLVAQYSGELATLKSNAVALKGLIDKHTNLLPAGVATKYQELNTLLPQLTSLVDTLKNYQTADLTSLVPKLKDDFARAQTLYTEIKSTMP